MSDDLFGDIETPEKPEETSAVSEYFDSMAVIKPSLREGASPVARPLFTHAKSVLPDPGLNVDLTGNSVNMEEILKDARNDDK